MTLSAEKVARVMCVLILLTKLFVEILVFLRDALVEISLLELFNDVVVIRVQLLGVPENSRI